MWPPPKSVLDGLAQIKLSAPEYAVVDMRLGDGCGLDVISALPVRILRRRVAPRQLSATKVWVSPVGSGAPCGREAIQRSASSRAGERSKSPPDRPAATQCRAASP